MAVMSFSPPCERIVAACLLAASCGESATMSFDEPEEPPPTAGCNVPYPAESTSPYILPWRRGESYAVTQGNCTASPTHSGIARFAYDFGMPIGATIIAARAGTVIEVDERFMDGNRIGGDENQIFIQHSDGTVARYYHLTFEGAVVAEEELVFQGQVIGFSGETGNTQSPHLHFDVVETDCGELFLGPLCVTMPITFSNTDPHPMGLQDGVTYVAR